MKIFGLEIKKTPAAEQTRGTHTYDYSSPDARVSTVEWLFNNAKNERQERENDWKLFTDYYEFAHNVSKEVAAAYEEIGLKHKPAMVPDPYIMVESQVSPDVPMPEFHGRDSDDDGYKALKRQKAVKFVIDNNDLNSKNTSNEKRLRKLGDAFFKAYWDASMPCGREMGDIRVKDIRVEDFYPDPAADDLEQCEYIDYVYTMHKMRFWREYHEVIEKMDISLDGIMGNQYRQDDSILNNERTALTKMDQVQIIEHWFRQPCDGQEKINGRVHEFKAGDIACSIQCGGVEIRYIPRYWKNTWRQNKNFPFIHYWCIRNENSFWNISEIEPIIHLVDSADRELATGLANDEMMANDITIVEEGALTPGSTITNMPGEVVEVKQGRINAVRRLGGLFAGIQSANMINWLQDQMQRTNRNFDANNGKGSMKVTTASGLLQIRSDAAKQSEIKNADRNNGFKRLYELIDWLCLEFYDDDRMLYIGAEDKEELPTIAYNSMEFAEFLDIVDPETGKQIKDKEPYFPKVDVTVTTGSEIAKDPATTLQILDKLAAVNVTKENYLILTAELEYLDIPQRQMITDAWRKKFERVQNEVPAAADQIGIADVYKNQI